MLLRSGEEDKRSAEVVVMVQPHKTEVNRALLKYAETGCFVWENRTGQAWVRMSGKRSRPVQFGFKGSADIIGVMPRVIKPEDVGKTIGQFLGVEVKVGKDTLSDYQEKFRQQVEKRGGLYIIHGE